MIGDVMRTAALLALAIAALPGTAAAAEDDRVPGKVVLSDGTVHEGRIGTTRGKPLRLVEADTGRRLDLRLSEIRRIVVRVVKEEQYRVWRWVEDGSREKVYTGESYPRREFETEITLRNGQVHRGGIVAVLYVHVEGRKKPEKMILRKERRGEVGETLADLVHVEAVEMDVGLEERAPSVTSLVLEVEPAAALVTAHAIPRGRDRSVEMLPADEPGRAVFPGILPGTYDLAVVTEDAIWIALGAGKEGGGPLDTKTLVEVESRVEEIPDFFEEKEVLHAVREGDTLRVVVRKRRTGRTSMDGNLTFRRWEVWSMHRGGDRWLVDARAFLWREHGEDLPAPREVRPAESLGGIVVESGEVKRRFRVPAKEER